MRLVTRPVRPDRNLARVGCMGPGGCIGVRPGISDTVAGSLDFGRAYAFRFAVQIRFDLIRVCSWSWAVIVAEGPHFLGMEGCIPVAGIRPAGGIPELGIAVGCNPGYFGGRPCSFVWPREYFAAYPPFAAAWVRRTLSSAVPVARLMDQPIVSGCRIPVLRPQNESAAQAEALDSKGAVSSLPEPHTPSGPPDPTVAKRHTAVPLQASPPAVCRNM
jgi:hypothetical protein